MKICEQCGIEFEPTIGRQKYHSLECAHVANHRKGKARDAKRAADRARWREEYRNSPPPAQPAQRRLPVLRARTLAETPDVPAEATRDDMLTGAAGACCTAGRVVHAHGGME